MVSIKTFLISFLLITPCYAQRGGYPTAWKDNGTYVIQRNNGRNVGIGTAAPAYALDVISANGIGIGTSAAGDTMVIDSSGRVGIGTAGPGAKLDVEGNIYLGSSARWVLFDQASAYAGMYWDGGDNVEYHAPATLELMIANDPKLLINSNGNVGIGTAAPGTKVELGSGQVSTPLGSTSAPPYSFTGDLNTGIYSPAADQVSMVGGGTARWTLGQWGRFTLNTDQINSSQALTWTNTGVLRLKSTSYIDLHGYSSATAMMRVLQDSIRYGDVSDSSANDTFNITNTITNQRLMKLVAAASQSANIIDVFDSASNALFSIDASGNVGIGTTSIPTTLTVENGAITLDEITAPATPAANHVVIYIDAADGDLKAKDDDGEVIVIADFSVD